MQKRWIHGSGEPSRVIALSSARFRLGLDLRKALGPAGMSPAQTGRTRDRTRPILHQRHKALAKAPSTRDPNRNRSQRRDALRSIATSAVWPDR